MRLSTLRSSLKSQKGFSIISIVFCLLAFGILGLTMTPMVALSSRGSVSSNQGQEAFFVANGGLQYILQNSFAEDSDLSDNISPTGSPFGGTSITLGTGEFWVEYSNLTATSADITVTGRVGNSVRKIVQSITGGDVAISKAVDAGNGIQLVGDGEVDGDIEYSNNLDNNLYTINGNINSGGSAPPVVNLTSLINQTTSVHSGDLRIDGDYTGNVHVTGTVEIKKGTITGIIVADNDVIINAKRDITVLGTLASGNSIDIQRVKNATFEPQMGPGGVMNPALIAANNIVMFVVREAKEDTDITIQGLIHAGSTVDFILNADGSSLLIEGAVIGGNDVKFKSEQGGYVTLDFEAGQDYLSPIPGSLMLGEWKEA